MAQELWDIIWNIVGGLIVAFLIFFFQWVRQKTKRKKFKKVFGNDSDNFYIVYPSYEAPKNSSFPKSPSKVPRRKYTTVNLTTINSNASTRSISHLSYIFGKYSKSLPQIKSDVDLDQQMDISFLSVGGLNNYKPLDVLDNTANIFLEFGNGGIQSKTSSESIANVAGKHDFGLILKIHPENNPNRAWLCVAGLGEWGTSGAAWWLSRYWKTIHKQAKEKPFACVTKTIYGSDDSTSLVHLFISKEDVENIAKKASNIPVQVTARAGRI